MRYRALSYILAACLSSSAVGQTFQFLQTDVNARVAAMGGSFVSMQNDPHLLFINPAGLTTLDGARASASYLDHLLDINAGSFVYFTDRTPLGPLVFGLTYYHYGSFDQTDALLNTSGTFTASDVAVSVGTAYEVAPQTSVGGAFKFIHSSIADYRSSALAFDLGFLYTVPEERFAVGVAVLHAGLQMSTFNGVRESLPLDVRIGVTKRPEHLPVHLNLNFHRLQESGLSVQDRLRQFSVGAEFDLSASVRLRLGFNNQLRKDLPLGTSAGLAGFSGGLGITVSEYFLDYAYNSYGGIGGLHRLSISASLSNE